MEGSNYEEKYGQWANGMEWMSNRIKKDKSEEKKR